MKTKTWKSKMEALVAGAVDYDDAEPLAMKCALIADKAVIAKIEQHARAKAEGKATGMDLTPLWSEVMPYHVEKLMQWAGGKLTDAQKCINSNIVRCGAVADVVKAGEVDFI
ncbi:MAG: hypothetical protein WCJ35_03415 [Planctomycetota bacterium]